jgi:hypothetical protein
MWAAGLGADAAPCLPCRPTAQCVATRSLRYAGSLHVTLIATGFPDTFEESLFSGMGGTSSSKASGRGRQPSQAQWTASDDEEVPPPPAARGGGAGRAAGGRMPWGR